MSRRDELLEQVTDHVLEEGLIGMTLRPVATAIGTSDRMLIYHFQNRDTLVAAVVAHAMERAVAAIETLPALNNVRDAVNRLWQEFRDEPLNGLLDIYCQAAASGLIGAEPYLSVVREANEKWSLALEDYLARCGAPQDRVERIVTLVDSSLFGFHLDLSVDQPDELLRGINDLADAAQALAET